MPAFLGEPSDPRKMECEWCGVPAVHAFELAGARKAQRTGQYIYVCERHREIGEQAASRRRPEKPEGPLRIS